jgi:acetoacetate decarboxylase
MIMAQLRYVRTPGTAMNASAPANLNNTVRSIRAVYETEPEIAAALLPKPLKAIQNPEIFLQFAHVAMHISEGNTVEIGAVTVGVRCTYETEDGSRRPGAYVLGMWMPGEFICIKGRERFGEPKKQAVVHFDIADNGDFDVSVERHGIKFIELKGNIDGESQGPKQFTEHFYCYKALPNITGEEGFDGDVILTQLNWQRNYSDVKTASGEITLNESANDPMIDVPVKRLISLEYAEGSTITGGEVLQTVPGEWLSAFIHQRYDEPAEPGIEIALASEAELA